MVGIRFGIRVLNFGRDASRQALLEQARLTDDEGYHSLWVAERLLVPFPPNQPWSRESPICFEVITLLSYLAAVTERVKLGTFVLVAPFRNPLVLAKQVSTLDVLSNGRVILGLGVGWMKEEFEAANTPMEERGARTDECIRFLREAWEGDRPSFKGRFFRLGPSLLEPKPVQKHIPVWVGGESEAALRRVGMIGDGWLPNTLSRPREVERCVSRIRAVAEANGRSMKDLTISCKLLLKGDSKLSATVRMIEKLRAFGVTHLIIDFEHGSASQYAEKIKLFSRGVMRSF